MKTHKLFTASNGEQHLTDEGVALFADALLLGRVEELPNSLRLHVEECEECKMQIMGVYELSKQLEPITQGKPHPYFDKVHIYRKPVFYRIAAIIAGAALIAVVYYALISNKTYQEPQLVKENIPTKQVTIEKPRSPETSTKDKQELLADNYSISPNLEDLVQTEFRSSSVEVISPRIGQSVQQPISFQWKDVDESVTIKILNNKEHTILSANVKGNSYTTGKKLPRGLYYWKLETEKDLLFVGKFLVK